MRKHSTVLLIGVTTCLSGLAGWGGAKQALHTTPMGTPMSGNYQVLPTNVGDSESGILSIPERGRNTLELNITLREAKGE